MSHGELWIAFAHVRPEVGHKPFGEGIKGGFTHVVGVAANEMSFLELAKEAFSQQNLLVVEFDDVDTVDNYRAEGRIPADLDIVIGETSKTGEIAFDTFYTYDKDNG